MSDSNPPAMSEAAQAVADSKIPPGDEYEEIREQVRHNDALTRNYLLRGPTAQQINMVLGWFAS